MKKIQLTEKRPVWSRFFVIFFSLAVAASFILTPLDASARSHRRSPVENPRYASLVMDANTGEILSQAYPDRQVHPASLTKIMTLLLVFEGLDSGRLSPRDRVSISRHAASMPASKLGINAGSTIRLQDAIYATVTESANDIAVALGEHLAGSESNFARMMTAKAHMLGMEHTQFVNASGLPDPRQVTTARDMAKLARYVILNYPEYYRYYSTNSFSYAGRNYRNHNHLMSSYQGMDGMKTGYISASGFNLVASAVRGNHRLIGVVFGGRSAASRNQHMAALLDAGFESVGRSPQTTTLIASLNPAASPSKAAPPGKALAPAPARKPENIILAAANMNSLKPALASADTDSFAKRAPEPVLTKLDVEEDEEPTGLAAWAIQVGAFSSRAATDKALHESMQKLPVKYASLSPIIAPMKTEDGWLFRARLHGLSKDDAYSACSYLHECVPVAPKKK